MLQTLVFDNFRGQHTEGGNFFTALSKTSLNQVYSDTLD